MTCPPRPSPHGSQSSLDATNLAHQYYQCAITLLKHFHHILVTFQRRRGRQRSHWRLRVPRRHSTRRVQQLRADRRCAPALSALRTTFSSMILHPSRRGRVLRHRFLIGFHGRRVPRHSSNHTAAPHLQPHCARATRTTAPVPQEHHWGSPGESSRRQCGASAPAPRRG